tara:strand:- start:419 stop:640 length:222 start_codon:yes stop_codon:yes gene_type:complete
MDVYYNNSMEYAYIDTVVNNEKKGDGALFYIQISSDDGRHFLFTEHELKRAEARAKKNPEDIKARDITFIKDH